MSFAFKITLQYLIKYLKPKHSKIFFSKCFLSKCRIKCFAAYKKPSPVSFFLKIKNKMFSRAMPTRRADILTTADILPVVPQLSR